MAFVLISCIRSRTRTRILNTHILAVIEYVLQMRVLLDLAPAQPITTPVRRHVQVTSE